MANIADGDGSTDTIETMTTKRARAEATPELPEALTGHAGFLAVRLGQEAQRAFQEAIAELDLKPSDYDFLATLGQGALSQRDLAQLLGRDASRIVATADSMAERGFVERSVDPSDRRRNVLTLTRAGAAYLRRANRVAARVEEGLLADLSDAERVTLRRLMRRVLDVR